MNGIRATNRIWSYFGETDRTHVTRLHEIGNSADGLFDRHVGIEPPRAIDVHVIQAEPGQRVPDEVLRRGRPGIDADPAAVGSAKRTELHGEEHLVTPVHDCT